VTANGFVVGLLPDSAAVSIVSPIAAVLGAVASRDPVHLVAGAGPSVAQGR
jgi:hypothetical protein